MVKAFDKIALTMARHPYISTALFVLAVNVVNHLVRSGQFTSYQPYYNQPYPTRFFTIQSPVVEYPYGNIANVGELLLEEEALFVMYYAPWCSRSMHLKDEFEKAARFFENEVLFVAINCWHKQSDCRQRNVFMSFPMFYFYVVGYDGFKYNGVLRADFMVEFVLLMLNPFKYITTQDQLAEFVSEKDTNVLGYFNFSIPLSQKSFDEFYHASLLTVERDPKHIIAYGVVTQAYLAEQVGLTDSPSAVLVRSLNNSLKYPSHVNFTSQSVAMWALTFRQQPLVKWLYPTGSKSLSLSSEMQQGPAIILFVPATPLLSSNHYTDLLRQIALMYHNCNQSSSVSGIVATNIFSIAKNLLRQQILERQCLTMSPDKPGRSAKRKPVPLKTCCATLRNNSCSLCFHYQHSHPLSVLGCSVFSTAIINSIPVNSGKCEETMLNYNPSEYVSSCCGEKSQKVSIKNTKSPSRASDMLLHEQDLMDTDPFVRDRTNNSLETPCRRLRRLKALGWATTMSDNDVRLLGQMEYPEDFVGLGCRTNRSVKFFAMDATDSHMFLKNLGLDAKSQEHKATVVLYSYKDEVLHVMKDEFLHSSTLSFIKNFTAGSLMTFRRTAVTEDNVECSSEQNHVCVLEVTSRTFRKIVLDDQKDVLLLYYTSWCGFCSGFAHIYLSLARYFRSVENIVFARINTDTNDIPWQYTVSEYPTLILYPAQSKSNSVPFPMHEPKTLPNLVKFVLRWSSRAYALVSNLRVCTRNCISTNLNMSATRIQALLQEVETTSLDISKVLSYRQKLVAELEAELENSINDGANADSVERTEHRTENAEQRSENEEHRTEEHKLLLNKIKNAKLHEDSLKRKLFKAELQLNSAKYLYEILQTSSEYSIDHEMLLSIINQRAMYKSRLKNYEML